MAKQIWKFPIKPMGLTVEMPQGAKVLTAHEQGNDICIWAEVDPKAPLAYREFAVYGTGHQMPADPGTYLGSAFLEGGRYVFHVYETATI